jgi:hypothetical protein
MVALLEESAFLDLYSGVMNCLRSAFDGGICDVSMSSISQIVLAFWDMRDPMLLPGYEQL